MISKTQILFSLVYLLILFCYFFSETSGNLTRRAINKMALASMFLINSAISIFKKGITPFSAILLLAIFFCFLGDFILLFSFSAAGVMFICANLSYAIYLLTYYFNCQINLLPALVVFITALLTYYLLVKKKYFKLKLISIYSGYIFSVIIQGSLGASLFIQASNPAERFIGLGLLFFMIADFFLFSYNYHQKKNSILRINSAFYFIGMLLITFYCYLV